MAGERKKVVVVEGGVIWMRTLANIVRGRTIGSGIEVVEAGDIKEARRVIRDNDKVVLVPVTFKSDEEDLYRDHPGRAAMYSRDKKRVDFHKKGGVPAFVDPDEIEKLIDWVVRGK